MFLPGTTPGCWRGVYRQGRSFRFRTPISTSTETSHVYHHNFIHQRVVRVLCFGTGKQRASAPASGDGSGVLQQVNSFRLSNNMSCSPAATKSLVDMASESPVPLHPSRISLQHRYSAVRAHACILPGRTAEARISDRAGHNRGYLGYCLHLQEEAQREGCEVRVDE